MHKFIFVRLIIPWSCRFVWFRRDSRESIAIHKSRSIFADIITNETILIQTGYTSFSIDTAYFTHSWNLSTLHFRLSVIHSPNHTYIFIGFMYFWQSVWRRARRDELISRKTCRKYAHDTRTKGWGGGRGSARETGERVRMRARPQTSSPPDATFRRPPPPGSVARRPPSDAYVFSLPLARLIARSSPWHFRRAEFPFPPGSVVNETSREKESARWHKTRVWSECDSRVAHQVGGIRIRPDLAIPHPRMITNDARITWTTRPNEARRYVTRGLTGIGGKNRPGWSSPRIEENSVAGQSTIWRIVERAGAFELDPSRPAGMIDPSSTTWRQRVTRWRFWTPGILISRGIDDQSADGAACRCSSECHVRCKSWLDWCATMILMSATTRRRRMTMIALAVSLMLLRADRAAGSERLGESVLCFYSNLIYPEFRESLETAAVLWFPRNSIWTRAADARVFDSWLRIRILCVGIFRVWERSFFFHTGYITWNWIYSTAGVYQ